MQATLQTSPGRLELILQDGQTSTRFDMAPDDALRLASELLSAAQAAALPSPQVEPAPILVAHNPSFRALVAPDAIVLSIEVFGPRPINLRFSDDNARLIIALFQKILAMPADYRGDGAPQ